MNDFAKAEYSCRIQMLPGLLGNDKTQCDLLVQSIISMHALVGGKHKMSCLDHLMRMQIA